MLNKRSETPVIYKPQCHNGEGIMICYSMLKPEESSFGLKHFQIDTLFPGASIGEHLHDCDEEIYCCIGGSGTLMFDGEAYPFENGDLSLVTIGHSHGVINTGKEELRLIVCKVGER